MFENKYPYTDFHELNLDYVLNQSAEVGEKVDHIDKEIVNITRETLQKMTDDGTLEELINETALANISNRVTALEPEDIRITSIEGLSAALCTCFIVEAGDKVILLDLGQASGGATIADKIVRMGITKIDAVVISHYHADHFGGLEPITSNPALDFSECTFYLPHKFIDVNRFVGGAATWITDARADVIAIADSLGASYVEPDVEGYTVNVTDKIKMIFNNINAGKYSDYYDYVLDSELTPKTYTNYNNFSMITTIEYKDKKFVYTADIMETAQAENRDVVRNASIVTAPHHALNRRDDAEFISNLTPDVFLISTYSTVYDDDRIARPTVQKLIKNGAKVIAIWTAKEVEVIMKANEMIVNTSANYFKNRDTDILSFGDVLKAGTDLNQLTTVGIYSVNNAPAMAALLNAPTDAYGGKIIVEQLNSAPGNAYILQTVEINNGQAIGTYKRRGRLDSGTVIWSSWRALMYGTFNYKVLTANDFEVPVTLTSSSSTRLNYINAQNGFLTVAMDFTTESGIDPDTVIIDNIETSQYYNCDHGLLYGITSVEGSSSKTYDFYPIQLYNNSTNGNYDVILRKRVPANTRLYTLGFTVSLCPTLMQFN